MDPLNELSVFFELSEQGSVLHDRAREIELVLSRTLKERRHRDIFIHSNTVLGSKQGAD